MIKIEEDDDEDDESEKSSDSESRIKFDVDYMDSVIEKVILVLKNSSRHFDYMRLYEAQLSAHLRHALKKYEFQSLSNCMEDVLIDISDTLYNELIFYTIMGNGEKKSSLTSSENGINLVKSLRKKKRKSPTKIEATSSESENDFLRLKGQHSNFNEMTSDKEVFNRLKVILNDKVASEEKAKKEIASSMCEETSSSESDDEQRRSSVATVELNINTSSKNEITIEDLDQRLNTEINMLDKIIMESIGDGLVGDDNVLPYEATRSEASSAGDTYVIINNSSGSDHEVIDEAKHSPIQISPRVTELTKEPEETLFNKDETVIASDC